jgi:hypothetical protein
VTKRIQKLAREKKPKQAINELTNLAKMGIQPDTMAATALVSACVANHNMDMAFNVFDELFGAPRLYIGNSWGLDLIQDIDLSFQWASARCSHLCCYEHPS